MTGKCIPVEEAAKEWIVAADDARESEFAFASALIEARRDAAGFDPET